MSRLVVVSNRVAPVKRAGSGSEGGLAVAVRAAMQDRGGIWFGWSGKVQEKETVGPDIFEVGKLTYAVLDLSQRDYEEYYNGYANRTLWPLFHYRLDLAEFHRRYVAGYYRVNALFASKLLPLLEPDDMIWVHDYHLIPIADLLRQAGCRNRIGFFLHIPWPTPEVFTALPNERNLVNALCAYDLVGFQTESDLRAFHDYIELEAGGIVHRDGTVEAYGRSVQAGAFPISIDTADVARMAEAEVRSRQSQRLRDSLKGRELMIGVDRLDYSKGLVTRIEAIELLLRDYPDSRTRVVTLQITPPSRTDVPEYLEIRRELEWV
ncbi:MAG TPA: trehalose-6-phosphate synthase, partial [Kiloniellales bacterium]|nr:trehalose-6-phosphate synthase [Kiloniellales bacterium]